MIVATGFLTTATDWKATGVRIFVPVDAIVPSTCTVGFYQPADGYNPELHSPVITATMTGIAAGQWNEVAFATPQNLTQNQLFFVGYSFGTGSYLSSTSVGSAAVQATDGSALFMSASNVWAGIRRQHYSTDGGANTIPSTVEGQTYGLDVIVSEV